MQAQNNKRAHASVQRLLAGAFLGAVLASMAVPARAAAATPPEAWTAPTIAVVGGRIIDGYFVAPSNASGLDVVVVLHGENGFDATARAVAHDHARAGKLAIVPDMPATYRGVAALAGRDAHVADIKAMRDAFGRHVRGNGKVEFVSA